MLYLGLPGVSPKYRTMAVPVSVAQNIELFTLSSITTIFIPVKEAKYWTKTVKYRTSDNPSCTIS